MLILMIPLYLAALAVAVVPIIWAFVQQHRNGDFAPANTGTTSRFARAIAFEQSSEESLGSKAA